MPQYDEYQAANDQQQIVLGIDEQEEYDAMGLPDCSPTLFYQALAIQLDRLPLLELDLERTSNSEVAA